MIGNQSSFQGNGKISSKRQKAIDKEVTLLIPAVPYFDAQAIKQAANAVHMKSLPPSIAVWLATIAYIRHQYSDYDQLRDSGYDADSARFFVIDSINQKLSAWKASRTLLFSETVA